MAIKLTKKYFQQNGLKSIDDLYEFAHSVRFGWMDKKGEIHKGVNDAVAYSLQTPDEVIRHKTAICWDLTELYRAWFMIMTDHRTETYYLYYDDGAGCPSHTILAYYDERELCWFEPFMGTRSGICRYKNITELLSNFCSVFLEVSIENGNIPQNYNKNDLHLFKYECPPYHINGLEMRKHIDESVQVTISMGD